MKFTLKDYQADAVDGRPSEPRVRANAVQAVGSCAAVVVLAHGDTGAGKTVMAAAVIEALFWGSDEFEFEPDPGAVVIWFSDDPNLNEQTRNRLMEASEKFTSSNLVRIEPPFAKPRLDPGKVYFLNTQKLTKTSRLTRGHVEPSTDETPLTGLRRPPRPTTRGGRSGRRSRTRSRTRTSRCTSSSTRRTAGSTRKDTRDKPTIVRKLVNGTLVRPADPDRVGHLRHDRALRGGDAKARGADETAGRLPSVTRRPGPSPGVGPGEGHARPGHPGRGGNFDSVLVRRAARKLARVDGAVDGVHGVCRVWRRRFSRCSCCRRRTRRIPIEVGRALDTIFEEYPDCVASRCRHVFGDHTTRRSGRGTSSGSSRNGFRRTRPSGCSSPRMRSRPVGLPAGRGAGVVPAGEGQHAHHPAAGRMVRSPLARRVPGDERLNAVDCILPFFDRTTAVKVVRFLTGELERCRAPRRRS